jgi:hypothetical protein
MAQSLQTVEAVVLRPMYRVMIVTAMVAVEVAEQYV